MAIIRNGSNMPKTFSAAIEIMQTESGSVSGLNGWGKGYRRGLRFSIKILRGLQKHVGRRRTKSFNDLLDVCKPIIAWWEDAQYKTESVGDGDEDNVFDEDEFKLFEQMLKCYRASFIEKEGFFPKIH